MCRPAWLRLRTRGEDTLLFFTPALTFIDDDSCLFELESNVMNG